MTEKNSYSVLLTPKPSHLLSHQRIGNTCERDIGLLKAMSSCFVLKMNKSQGLTSMTLKTSGKARQTSIHIRLSSLLIPHLSPYPFHCPSAATSKQNKTRNYITSCSLQFIVPSFWSHSYSHSFISYQQPEKELQWKILSLPQQSKSLFQNTLVAKNI